MEALIMKGEKMTIHYVQQLDEADCGAAVLAMIFKNYKSNISIASIRDVAQTDKDGTTALGLVKAAEHLDFETQAVQADMSLFKMKKSEVPLPFIAHVDKDNGMLHYVVVFEIHKNYLLVADPDPVDKIKKMSYADFEKIWTGVTIFMAPAPEYKPTKDNKDSLWSLAGLIFKQKSLVTTIILAATLSTLISIGGSFFLQQLIDTYIPDGMVGTLSIVALGLLVAYVFHGIFGYVEGYLSTVLGQRLSIDLLLSYIKHLFEVPMSFFGTRKTGEITSRFEDASNIIDTLASTAISTFLNVGTILLVGITLAIISVKLFLISCLALPLYLIIVWSFVKLFDRLNNERMESGAVLSSSIIEDLNGMETIKSLNVEKQRYRKIDHEFVDMLHKNYSYGITTIVQENLKDVTQLVMDVAFCISALCL
ncbi:ABC superfamily ATP binding cassette transporter [Pediococcus claussenii]|nr:ABC superfamily ATP binding cassette transporter [Pediococcus claussenii]